MSPVAATFLFELANFLLLAALVGWLLFRPVRAALTARQQQEQERASALEKREQEITRKSEELAARSATFEETLATERKDRLAAADKEASEIVSHARATAERARDRSRRMLEHLEQAEVERLAGAVAAAAREAVARLLIDIESPALDHALLLAVCRKLEADGDPSAAVLVESAAPLEQTDRDALAKAARQDVRSVDFRVVPDLHGGLRVTTASGLIDASAAGIADHAGRVLTRTLTEPAAEPEPIDG
jgi:F-type H+-transporting ATPase subunit b